MKKKRKRLKTLVNAYLFAVQVLKRSYIIYYLNIWMIITYYQATNQDSPLEILECTSFHK